MPAVPLCMTCPTRGASRGCVTRVKYPNEQCVMLSVPLAQRGTPYKPVDVACGTTQPPWCVAQRPACRGGPPVVVTPRLPPFTGFLWTSCPASCTTECRAGPGWWAACGKCRTGGSCEGGRLGACSSPSSGRGAPLREGEQDGNTMGTQFRWGASIRAPPPAACAHASARAPRQRHAMLGRGHSPEVGAWAHWRCWMRARS